MEWKNAFKLPLQFMGDDFTSKVFTSELNMAFDFMSRFMSGLFKDIGIIEISDTQRQHILDLINGDRVGFIEGDVKYDDVSGTITLDGKVLILIRGWGYLTGSGGLGLRAEDAAIIQQDFAKYIVSQLSINEEKRNKHVSSTRL